MGGRRHSIEYRTTPSSVPDHSSVPVKVQTPTVSPYRVGLSIAHWLLCRSIILTIDVLSIASVIGAIAWFMPARWDDRSNKTVFINWILNWNPFDTVIDLKAWVVEEYRDCVEGCRNWWNWILERSTKG